jgi:hypothetical protein
MLRAAAPMLIVTLIVLAHGMPVGAQSPSPETASPAPVTSPSAAAGPSPTAAIDEQMTVSGVVPVPPGTPVRIEALDLDPIGFVECSGSISTSDAALDPAQSRFTLSVSRSCFADKAANLRVCWRPTECSEVSFVPGAFDLGELRYQPPTVSAPDTGGPAAPEPAPVAEDGSDRTLTFAIAATGVVVGLILIVTSLLRGYTRRTT